MDIIGAGLSGLIAAHVWPNADIFEKQPEPKESHAALLRFRSDAVSALTGIEFKKVRVRKGIWFDGAFHQPNIKLANAYSKKCLGAISPDRSIWNLDPVDRFIAPDNFYAQLIEATQRRIEWGYDYPFAKQSEPSISTIPLPVLMEKLMINETKRIGFRRAPIQVQKYFVNNCNEYQTIYFPADYHQVYRASLTGSTLIVEYALGDKQLSCLPIEVLKAFHIESVTLISETSQQYGKIEGIDDAQRKSMLFQISQMHNIYSLGRFAIWKNILLDDVVNDANVIKRLIKSNSSYEHLKATSL